LSRLKYESSHWDDAIHGYRETERRTWSQRNKRIIERIRQTAFTAQHSPNSPAHLPNSSAHSPNSLVHSPTLLAHVHVLDLLGTGVIKPHIDSSRFCGDTVSGLSLLSQSVMRLVHKDNKTRQADILLPRLSLYVMMGLARYDYTHEILSNETSEFRGTRVVRQRRIAVICRNEPMGEER